MIPCLYDSREMRFDHNGIGKLADAQSCTVTEKRNGSYELKLICPADGIHAEMLEEGNIILAKPSDTMQSQPFRIYKITTPIDGKLEVQARHISYQLNFITVSPFSVTGCVGAMQGLKSHAASDCPFNVWTDVESSATFTLGVPSSFRNCLGGMAGSVLDVFGGEFEWDRYMVKFHKARGADHKHGNAYIICTIEEVMDSIHCARQKAVKLLDELEHEFRLIERRRQGLCKPNLLYVKDLYAGLSQSNYWKYENHTSGGLKNELPGVPKSNGSNTEKINKTDNSETDPIYPTELQEEEQYRRYFKEALELEILEQGYPADKAVLYEILELLVETVTSRKRFLRICGEEKPREVVKSRLMKLDSSHIQYILECLKENSTQIRNIKQYLLATLYNAPVTVDSYYSAQVRREFGWGGRVDKN